MPPNENGIVDVAGAAEVAPNEKFGLGFAATGATVGATSSVVFGVSYVGLVNGDEIGVVETVYGC